MSVALKKPSGFRDWVRLYRLYMSSFPSSERKPFGVIVDMHRQGKTDLWCLMAGDRFAGLAATINGGDLVLLDYFAVEKPLRGQGLGSAALGLLQECYADRGLFVEIETTRGESPNQPEREKRKRFYLSSGMEDLGTEAKVFGVNMELLGARCRLDFEGYRAFYRDHYGPWSASHIEPAEKE